MIEDIHTHTPGRPTAVLSLAPVEVLTLSSGDGQLYSVSLHPWYVTPTMLDDFDRVVESCAADPRWYAVGECGLDPLCETPMELQVEALRRSLDAARLLHKPTVIHCVRRWDDLLREVRHVWGPRGAAEAYSWGLPIIIHGYRRGLPLAQSLLAQGFCLSLGEHFQPDVARAIPPERLYIETDESRLPIAEIRRRILDITHGFGAVAPAADHS